MKKLGIKKPFTEKQGKNRYFKNKKVFITGAGSGIGQATARKLASLGCYLLLADIHQEGLDDTVQLCQPHIAKHGTEAQTYLCDVTDFAAMQQLAAEINSRYGHVDILINNAGIALAGRFLDCEVSDWKKIIDINVMGVVHGCKAFMPAMLEAGKSGKTCHVINLSSMAGYYAAPDMSVYSASKFAVFGLSESLRAEVAADNVVVSAICPGIIHTNIIKNAPFIGSEDDREKINKIYARRKAGPDLVADAIIHAIRHKKAVQPVTTEAWALYGAKRLSPTVLNKFSARAAKRHVLRRPK